MMSTPDDETTPPEDWIGQLKGFVRQRIPERWRGRLGLLRGIFVKEPAEQLERLFGILRHFRDYRRVDRALFYHRFAAHLLLSYRLGIFDALGDEIRGVDEVCDRCDIDEAAARNLLRILQSQGFVQRSGDGYEATAFARAFFDPDQPGSMAPMFEIAETYARGYPAFFEAAQTGRRPAMLDIYNEQGRVDALLDGVNYYIDQAGRELLTRVDWPPIEHVIVGSMGVSFSSLVLSHFPDARVTYGCLPHLVERIPRLRREYGVPAGRVVETHAHGGEPAEDKWGREAFDLVFLTKKMILDPANDLGDKFARKAHQVLNPGGVCIFWETIHDDEQPRCVERGMEGFLDFGVSPTGPVLTEKGFGRMLDDIGFRDVEVVSCLEGATTFAVARK